MTDENKHIDLLYSGEGTYFIKSGNQMKIGYSNNPIDRLTTLQVGNPNSMELFFVSDRYNEDELQEKFKKDRIRGEWFVITEEMLKFIDEEKRRQQIEVETELNVENCSEKITELKKNNQDVENDLPTQKKSYPIPKEVRKLQFIGRSYLVTLPPSFLDRYGLRDKENPTVKVIENTDGSLTIVPEDFEQKLREITIEVYREVGREVVENILSGTEKITLLSDTEIDTNIKKELHLFLSGLPQAEIFEEGKYRIVIYKIGFTNTLNRKLLHRLFNIISELFQYVEADNSEMVGNSIKDLKRFYMILVGNIRTYHHTGITKDNEEDFSQKKASDYRLLAYQLKRIGRLLSHIENFDARLTIFYNEVKNYYEKIFSAFIKKEMHTAYELWFRNRSIIENGEKMLEKYDGLIKSDFASVKWNMCILLNIVEICRNMTALIS